MCETALKWAKPCTKGRIYAAIGENLLKKAKLRCNGFTMRAIGEGGKGRNYATMGDTTLQWAMIRYNGRNYSTMGDTTLQWAIIRYNG